MEKYEGKSGVVLMHTHFVAALSDVGAGREEAKKKLQNKMLINPPNIRI